jgi:hypothetical protein
VNLVREEERRGPKTWPKGTNRDTVQLGVLRTSSDQCAVRSAHAPQLVLGEEGPTRQVVVPAGSARLAVGGGAGK